MTKMMFASLLSVSMAFALSCSCKAQNSMRPLELGFNGCTPAVFLAFERDLEVTVSNVNYSEGSSVFSYELKIQYGQEEPILVEIESLSNDACGDYVATINGSRSSSPNKEAYEKNFQDGLMDLNRFAFSPDESGGIIRRPRPVMTERGPGFEMQIKDSNKFSYTETGQRQLSEQEFEYEGTKYHVVFSQHKWKKVQNKYTPDGYLRPSGYVARIVDVSLPESP